VTEENRTTNTTALKSVFNTSMIREANSTVNVTKYKKQARDYTKLKDHCSRHIPQQKLNIDLNPKMIQEFSKNNAIKQESVQRKKMINFDKIVEYES